MEALKRMTAANGCLINKGTDAVTGRFDGFIAFTDTVIAELALDGVVVALVDYGLTNTTIPAGQMWWCPMSQHITSITLTSGTINLIRS